MSCTMHGLAYFVKEERRERMEQNSGAQNGGQARAPALQCLDLLRELLVKERVFAEVSTWHIKGYPTCVGAG
jgi:hypothetical protein